MMVEILTVMKTKQDKMTWDQWS